MCLILAKNTRMGHMQWPYFTRMGHIQCRHINRMGNIQCPHFTRMGHIQFPNSKTATGKPFAQRWILGCHRILTLMLTLPSVGSKLGRIGFTMSSRRCGHFYVVTALQRHMNSTLFIT